MKTTLIAATLNEIEGLRVVLPGIDKTWVDEIIITDGHSTDGTIEYCRREGYFVHLQRKRGYGAAIQEVLPMAQGDIIVEFPADGSSLPEKIPELIAKIRDEGYDLVIASRYKEQAKSYDDDVVTAIGNKLFTAFTNVLFGASYTDVLVGYRAYKKGCLEKLKMDTSGLGWGFQSSVQFAKVGFKVCEIPADEPKRIGGSRKMKPFRTGVEILFLLLKEYFRK